MIFRDESISRYVPGKESGGLSPEAIDRDKSFGLLMVKPHARDQAIDVSVAHILGFAGPEVDEKIVKALNLSAQAEHLLFRSGKLKPVSMFTRDMGSDNPRVREQNKKALDIMYGRDKDKRYYPTILERYSGKVMFFLVQYDGSQRELEEILRDLKGKETFIGEKTGSGLRGTFIPPKEKIDLDNLEKLPEEQYQKEVMGVIDNVIHATDHTWETAEVLKLFLSEEEIDEIEKRGFPLREFIKRNEKPSA